MDALVFENVLIMDIISSGRTSQVFEMIILDTILATIRIDPTVFPLSSRREQCPDAL